MERCFSTLGCAEFSLDEVSALAARHGIAAVELRALGGTTDLPAYFAKTFGTPEALAAEARRRPLRVVALNTGLRLIGGSQSERESVLAFAPWAEALGAPWLRVFDGGCDMDADERAEAADTLRWWQAARRQHGWRTDLVVETHDALCSAEALQRFLDAQPQTALLWDAHHTWRKGGEDPVSTWHTLHRRVVHVHVKDSVPVPSSRHPFTYVVPGEGDFPIGKVMAALRDGQFAGAVSLEWERLWHPELPPLDRALAAATERAWW